jgi:GT2 family glycosyltransferase
MRSSAPPITVLLAVHNGQRYVRQAVQSVLEQTWDDFELCIVDDGSTDETGCILAQIHDSRIILLRNEHNRGLPSALNRGLSAARGEYVARIDADDLCEPQRLARQIEHMRAHPDIVILGTWTTEIDEAGHPVGAFEVAPHPGYIAWALTHRNVIYHPTVMMPREFIQSLGGYDEQMTYAQDHDLFARAIMAGGIVTVLPERLVRYRRAPGQISSARAGRQMEFGLRVRQRYCQWLLERRELPMESVADVRLLLEAHAAEEVKDLDGALDVVWELRRAAVRRCDRRGRGLIDRALADVLLRQAWRCTYDRPQLSGALTMALMRMGGWRRRDAWGQLTRLARRPFHYWLAGAHMVEPHDRSELR